MNLLRLTLSLMPLLIAPGLVGCAEPASTPDRPALVRTHDRIVQDELNRVGRLSFEADRRTALARLAADPRLPPDAQVALVHATFAHLRFDSGRQQVLLTLIGNPSMSRPAAAAVLENLDRLKLPASRDAVLDALHRRADTLN